MNYKLIDHTADFGIHVFGLNPKDLFINAASAMFEQIAESEDKSWEKKHDIKISGADWPDLMVNWLRELLFLWSARQMLIKDIDISSITETGLAAVLAYDAYHPDNHILKSEIKAVTYHQIQVKESSTGWEAKIIFDV